MPRGGEICYAGNKKARRFRRAKVYVLCVSSLPNAVWSNRAYTDKQILLWSEITPFYFKKQPKSDQNFHPERACPHRIQKAKNINFFILSITPHSSMPLSIQGKYRSLSNSLFHHFIHSARACPRRFFTQKAYPVSVNTAPEHLIPASSTSHNLSEMSRCRHHLHDPAFLKTHRYPTTISA